MSIFVPTYIESDDGKIFNLTLMLAVTDLQS
jgi:hypothetical protein